MRQALQSDTDLVVFVLAGQRFGLWLSTVSRVLGMVELTPLPTSPTIVLGIVNHHGEIVPVADLRWRLGLPRREPVPEDVLIFARTPRRTVGLVVDSLVGVEPVVAGDCVKLDTVVVGTDPIRGVAKRPDGLVLIHDLEALLSFEEEAALDAALAAREVAP